MSLASIVLLLLTPALGVIAGYAARGRLARLAAIPFHASWLLFLGAALQAAQYYAAPVRNQLEHRLGVPILAIVFALVVTWLAVNLPRWPSATRLAGAVILLGATLNGLVILVNSRMPYSPAAATVAGIKPGLANEKNMPAGNGTRLRLLGDTVPISPLHKVVSPGDALIVLGGGSLIALAMRGHRRPLPMAIAEGGEHAHHHDVAASDLRALHSRNGSAAALYDRRASNRRKLIRHGPPASAGGP